MFVCCASEIVAYFKWCHSGRPHCWIDLCQVVEWGAWLMYFLCIFHLYTSLWVCVCVWVCYAFYAILFFKCGYLCYTMPSPLRYRYVYFCSSWETNVITLWTLVGHSSLLSRQGLSVTIWISLFLSTSLFIPTSLLIYPSRPPPSADAHPGVSESYLNHSLTERGKERGDGGRDKGAWEIESGKKRGMRVGAYMEWTYQSRVPIILCEMPLASRRLVSVPVQN